MGDDIVEISDIFIIHDSFCFWISYDSVQEAEIRISWCHHVYWTQQSHICHNIWVILFLSTRIKCDTLYLQDICIGWEKHYSYYLWLFIFIRPIIIPIISKLIISACVLMVAKIQKKMQCCKFIMCHILECCSIYKRKIYFLLIINGFKDDYCVRIICVLFISWFYLILVILVFI